MRYGRIAAWRTRRWLEDLRTDDLWFALCSEDPFSVADPLVTEVLGPVYRRPQAVFEFADTALLRNANAHRWAGLAVGTRVAAIACFDAAHNGNVVLRSMLPTPRDFPAGGTFTLEAGEFFIGIDVLEL